MSNSEMISALGKAKPLSTRMLGKVIPLILEGVARWQSATISQKLLLLIGALFVLVGFAFFVAPVSLAQGLGMQQLLPTAITDVRAFYGTMTASFGVFFMYSSQRKILMVPALMMVIVFSGGSAIGRLFGVVLDGSFGWLHSGFFIGEVSCCYFCWKAITREQSRERTNQVVANPVHVNDFTPLSQKNLENPYPFYQALRKEAPVYKIPGTDFFTVSRYEDIKNIALNTDDYSSNLVAIILGTIDGATKTMDRPESKFAPVDVLAIQDPPRHGTQRRLGLQNLSLRFVQGLEPMIKERSIDIINRFIDDGEVDWVKAFAKELPMIVSLTLVGFPTENWKEVKNWCDHSIALLSGVNTAEEFAEHSQISGKLNHYVRKQFDLAKHSDKDNFSKALYEAVQNPEHDLTDDEAVSMVFQLLIAGSDSTANTLGNSVKMLAETPDIQIALRKHPERISHFIEEVLRLESPFQGHFRKTTKDVVIAGTNIPKDSRLMLLWASANRDESVYDNPEKIDLDRHNLKAHLGFGRGIHQCLGAQLARLEIRVALEEMIKRTEIIVIDNSKPVATHLHSVFIRELSSLPLRFTKKEETQAVEVDAV